MAEVLRVSTGKLKEVVDLTGRIESLVRRAKLREGVCSLFITHTTAALTTGEIGEGTEQDLLDVIERIIPSIRFRHAHDPSHAWSHMGRVHAGSLAQRSRSGRTLDIGHVAIGLARRIGRSTGMNRLCDAASGVMRR